MSNRKFMIISTSVILFAQFALLAFLIIRWEVIAGKGVECRFKCNVYDPSDPFRGRFVRVFVAAEIGEANIGTNETANSRSSGEYYIRIEPDGTNGLSRVAEMAEEPGPDGIWVGPRPCQFDYRLEWNNRNTDETSTAFEQRRAESGKVWRTHLPGQLFMNEKVAPKADELMRSASDQDIVAVYRVMNRKILITGIEVNGVPLNKIP